MFNFYPKKIYYEREILDYPQGIELMDKYSDIEKICIKSHNNIEELRTLSNDKFVMLKDYLILGVRKVLRPAVNNKTSDYLVPFTSSGCSAMCLYCYLVCHYNKCSYLRVFVNRDAMLEKLVKKTLSSEKDLVFEVGSNSDLVLENEVTNNLPWIIEEFGKVNKGYITFPTKFSMVDPILKVKHNGRTIIRMSINPEYIIKNIEIRTCNLLNRIEAVNKLVDAGYKVGILVAPVILLENYEKLYDEMLNTLEGNLSEKAKKTIFFEVIFMTYSFVHDKINTDAFPGSVPIFNKRIMTGRGMGKYMYKQDVLNVSKLYIREKISYYFPHNKIEYIV